MPHPSDVLANDIALPIEIPALDNTFGAVLNGTFVGLVLYGLMLHQAYRYARVYQRDASTLKYMVAVVVLLETFVAIQSMHICYWYLVQSYFKPQHLLRGVWSLNILPVTSGVVVVVCQSFFMRRVWLFGIRYRPIAVISVVLLAGELAFYGAAAAEAFRLDIFSLFEKYSKWMMSTAVGMIAITDVLLTAVLIFALRRSRTGIKKTDSMIEVLILYTITTGLITSVVTVISVFMSFLYPDNLIYAALGILGGRLYANSFLAALNARQGLVQPGPAMLTFRTTYTSGGDLETPVANVTMPRRVYNKGPTACGSISQSGLSGAGSETYLELTTVKPLDLTADEMNEGGVAV